MRPNELFPQMLLDELLRLGRLDRNWVRWTPLGGNEYAAECAVETWTRSLWYSGADAFAMWAGSIWLADGPKIFQPTPEQCDALEQVEVNLTLGDYSQPFPAIAVELPKGRYEPFTSVLCHKSENLLTCVSYSRDHLNDITTTIGRQDSLIEKSLQRFDENLTELGQVAGMALRVACNACLALSSYGHHIDYLFPKEVERDQRLAKEKSERGERARSRLSMPVMLTSLDQRVVLHRTERTSQGNGESTGREMPPHWRRGHWHTVAHGVGRTERKRVLYPPTMVRADLFVGQTSDTQLTYQ